MNSKHLVDPQLLPALDEIPLGDITARTLSSTREEVAALRLPAPPAPDVTAEERFVSGFGKKPLRLIVYAPKVAPRAGGLLWLHPGGMVMNTPDTSEAQSRYLAQRFGCVVVAVNYSLAPENPYPAGLEDCAAALEWMHEAADEFRIPRERIAVMGESGGGGLAAGLSLLARDRGGVPLSAQFLQYPMLDDRTGTTADPGPMPYAGEFVWTRASNNFAWESVLGKEPGTADVPVYAAPGRAQNLAGLPPTFLMIGSLDLFVGENLRYALTLIRDGVPLDLHVYQGAYHAFTTFSPEAEVSVRALDEFYSAIERHFREKGHK